MRSPIAHSRIFVALTLTEAAAISRLPPSTDPDAIGAVAKIRTALAGVTCPPPAAGAPPPLRSKHYIAPPPLAIDPRAPKLRMAKAAIATPPTPAPDDDYVPFRDEADGVWK